MKRKAADLDLVRFPATPFVEVTKEIKSYWEKMILNNVLKQLYPNKDFNLNTKLWLDLEFVQNALELHIRINRVVHLKLEQHEVPVQLHIWFDKDIDPLLKPYTLKNTPFATLGSEFILTERNYHIPLGYTTKTEKVFKEQFNRIYQRLLKIRKENDLVGEVKIVRKCTYQIVTGYLSSGEEVELIYSQAGILREKKVSGETVDLYKKAKEVDKPKVIRKASSKR